ncbi:protein involved in gliding motility RemB [Lutibacter agarilyticus]|uniref:Protein involved in gliding motility RemB n=1 Tax=Lutibacter agarilyticus TaxID=1109740 RepID=A0A238VRU2_9FLAO|nr:gliding motility protein RemB [Lutibacter agarilyticus]SNR37052.1 protein involved in gliding motility RemB [Lutibacter agarilyticus]
MNKTLLPLLCFLFSVTIYSQIEKYPVFKACDTVSVTQMQSCFNSEFKNAVITEFKTPKNVLQDNYRGTVNTVFLVTTSGEVKLIYVNSPYKELKTEIERVVLTLPKIEPAKYNNRTVEMQFILPLKIPLEENVIENFSIEENSKVEIVENDVMLLEVHKTKKDSTLVNQKKALFPEHKSELNVPFVHATYNEFDQYLGQGENTHTSMKPYVYSDVMPYLNLDVQKTKLLHERKTWFGRKLWNEHLVNVQGEDFWLTLDLPLDLQLGRDSEGITTFNNTRALQINGGIGGKFNFSTTFYESQGRFSKYFNEYAELLKPDGGNPALIPGRGIAKGYKSDAYDYPVAEAYLSYAPNKHFSFQFGNGKNFIGDGYRSLLLSDVASPLPYFKINTSFWKIKYTNLWMWGQDVRPELTVDGAYKQKFMSLHYLSWNITKRFNLGLYETVIWDDTNGRGFDVNYLNPIIFYTAVEFATGSRAGNVLLGMNLKYKFNAISLYGQLILDEFRGSEITSNSGWWANKFGYQLGAKFFNAFNVDNLYFQAEFNSVRPYTYSHDELNYNFGHNNQPMAHLWGANFREFIGIGRYSFDRWFFDAKAVVGKKGFDFNTTSDSYSYGGDVFRDNDDRASDYGNSIGQGNTANVFIGDLQAGYLINPATNLKLYGRVAYRSFQPTTNTTNVYSSNSTWFSIGLKAELFNWYFDF